MRTPPPHFSLFPREAALESTKKVRFTPAQSHSQGKNCLQKGRESLEIHPSPSDHHPSPLHQTISFSIRCQVAVGLWLYRHRADKNKPRLMEETAIALVCFFVTCWAEAVFTLWNVTKKSKVIMQVHLSVSLLQLLLCATMRWQGIYCWWLVISRIIGNISTI